MDGGVIFIIVILCVPFLPVFLYMTTHPRESIIGRASLNSTEQIIEPSDVAIKHRKFLGISGLVLFSAIILFILIYVFC